MDQPTYYSRWLFCVKPQHIINFSNSIANYSRWLFCVKPQHPTTAGILTKHYNRWLFCVKLQLCDLPCVFRHFRPVPPLISRRRKRFFSRAFFPAFSARYFMGKETPRGDKSAGRVKRRAMRKRDSIARSGSDLLFRVLRQSTIGASGFHFRVRNGIECFS